MRLRLTVAVLLGGLILAGTAGGYALGRVVALHPGDTGSFVPVGAAAGWWCHYFQPSAKVAGGRSYVSCIVGDQTPTVRLLAPSKSPLSVEVDATVGATHVRKVRRRLCAEPGRCYFEDTYTFSGGAGG